MNNRTKQEAVAELWREALSDYRQEGLRRRLSEEWPGDRNVNERLAYEYPPTFQPGYVGPSCFESDVRIVLLGQNPGEGSQPNAVVRDREYRAKLEAFERGDSLFGDVNRLVASDMVGWGVFKGKGIFRETGAARISLVDEDVRPSIEDVGYVNYFPFKTSANRSPLTSSPFGRHVQYRKDDARGILPAWVADEYLLGRPAIADRVLAQAAARGELRRRGGVGPRDPGAYIRAVKALLRKTGYSR